MFFHRKDPFRNEALIGYTETPALWEKKKPGGEAGPSPVHANLSAEHAGRINDTGCRKQPDGDQS
jgi:hypothetical protein